MDGLEALIGLIHTATQQGEQAFIHLNQVMREVESTKTSLDASARSIAAAGGSAESVWLVAMSQHIQWANTQCDAMITMIEEAKSEIQAASHAGRMWIDRLSG